MRALRTQLALILLAIAALSAFGIATARQDVDIEQVVLPAVVQIAVRVVESGGGVAPAEQLVPRGSGTVVSADGLVLTSAHVLDVADLETDAAALQASYQQQGIDRTVRVVADEFILSFPLLPDQPPFELYTASAVAFDADLQANADSLDLAVLRIVGDPNNQPVSVPELRFVELGDSDRLGRTDRIFVVGYPGIAETAIIDSGEVNGFAPAPGISGRAWIVTDATVSGGSSGGAAVDGAGRLIGVITLASALDCRPGDTNADGAVDDLDVGCVPVGSALARLRPINLAAPLLAAAGIAPPPAASPTAAVITIPDLPVSTPPTATPTEAPPTNTPPPPATATMTPTSTPQPTNTPVPPTSTPEPPPTPSPTPSATEPPIVTETVSPATPTPLPTATLAPPATATPCPRPGSIPTELDVEEDFGDTTCFVVPASASAAIAEGGLFMAVESGEFASLSASDARTDRRSFGLVADVTSYTGSGLLTLSLENVAGDTTWLFAVDPGAKRWSLYRNRTGSDRLFIWVEPRRFTRPDEDVRRVELRVVSGRPTLLVNDVDVVAPTGVAMPVMDDSFVTFFGAAVESGQGPEFSIVFDRLRLYEIDAPVVAGPTATVRPVGTVVPTAKPTIVPTSVTVVTPSPVTVPPPPPADTDFDGLTDDREIVYGTDPLNPDTDGDGASDGEEVDVLGTDPLVPDQPRPDSDDDGLFDDDEISVYFTDPYNPDTDFDGSGDGYEVSVGTNPRVSDALTSDCDADGWSDSEEASIGTDPCNGDTDFDGVPDPEDPNPFVPESAETPPLTGDPLTTPTVVPVTGG